MPEHTTQTRPDAGNIVFVVLAIVFTALLLYESLRLAPSPRLLPQLIGVPTLAFLLFELARQVGLIRRVSSGAGGSPVGDLARDQVPAHPELPGQARTIDELASALELRAQAEGYESGAGTNGRWRRIGFALWSLGFVVLANMTDFMLATPIALLVILYLGTRKPVLAAAVTAVVVAGIWLVFDMFLEVPF